MKPWSRKISQEEWDNIFNPANCPGCDDPSCGVCAEKSRKEAAEADEARAEIGDASDFGGDINSDLDDWPWERDFE